MKKTALKKLSKGFTLVEILISTAILGILTISLFFVIDPMNQFYKAWDAQKKHDLEQIIIAMDKYYNDHGCYPTPIPGGRGFELPYGQEWKDNEMVYMTKVPNDKHTYCRSEGDCFAYYYRTDSSQDCPQWGVFYTHLFNKDANKTTERKKNCPLWTKALVDKNGTVCKSGLESGFNYCMITGNIDCTILNVTPTTGPTIPSSTTTSSTTTTIPSSTTTSSTTTTTTTRACQSLCTCSIAQFWKGYSGTESCQSIPSENYCTQIGHNPCYCSADCSGCGCQD